MLGRLVLEWRLLLQQAAYDKEKGCWAETEMSNGFCGLGASKKKSVLTIEDSSSSS